MKLSLQNKVLLPSVLTLLVSLIIGALLVSYASIRELQKETITLLQGANTLLVKNAGSTSSNLLENMGLVASNSGLQNYIDLLEQNDANIDKREQQEAVNTILEGYFSKHRGFMHLNLADSQGQIVGSSNRNYIGKYSVADRTYFREGMAGNTFISEPVISKSTGEKAVVIACPVRTKSGKIGGILYGMISCERIISDTVKGVKIGRTGYSYLIDGRTGLMLAHPNIDKVVKVRMFENLPWLRELRSGEQGVNANYTSSEGVKRLLVYQKDITSNWIAVTTCNASELDEAVSTIRNITLIVLLLSGLGVAIVLWLVIRKMSSDIARTNHFAQAIASGNLDSTLDVKRTDELGSLGDALRLMVESLKKMIFTSQEESLKAEKEAEKAKQAVEEALDSRRQAWAVQERVLSVAERLGLMSTSLTESIGDLNNQIARATEGANDSAKRLSDAAAAMNEMTSTVQEVARNASTAAKSSADTREKALNGADTVKKSISSIEEMRKASLSLKDDMTELNEHAKSISTVMSVISDIADQTNLLALNAAIEAARAGEAGRGFAVVADEVRKLAEKTMASTADVAEATRAIQESTAKSMSAMTESIDRLEDARLLARDSGTALEEIVVNVQETTDEVNAIATAAEEQSAATEQISHSVSEVNQISTEVAQAMVEASGAISNLAKQTDDLNRLMKEMRESKEGGASGK